MFEPSIRTWKRLSTVMDSFTSRALIFSRFVRPVANFIFANTEKESNKVDSVRKVLELLLPSPQTFPLVTVSPVNVKMRKYVTDSHVKRISHTPTNEMVTAVVKSHHHL